MKRKGYFVISLDFELMWGMFDKVSLDSYGKNIEGVSAAIPLMLSLFEKYNIHATWATVGMLMYEDAAALNNALPDKSAWPRYKDEGLSSYYYFKSQVLHRPELKKYHFAPELVRRIIATPYQELASHTFSHYYCLDGGENGEAIFAADCHAQELACAQFGYKPQSIIFPRNQTTNAALKVCHEVGMLAYRGTEGHFLYRPRKESAQANPVIRGLRLLDHYLNISGHHTYALPKGQHGQLINLPASRFLRPYSHTLRKLEKFRLRRIKQSMTHAAKHGEVFHLWWHPHNFGINRKENFTNLLAILEHYKKLHTDFNITSQNMSELATLVNESNA